MHGRLLRALLGALLGALLPSLVCALLLLLALRRWSLLGLLRRSWGRDSQCSRGRAVPCRVAHAGAGTRPITRPASLKP